MTKSTNEEFLSDSTTERIRDLFKKINISQFAEEHGLARKTLYNMRDKGLVPRGLLSLLCEEANVNPILVEYSPSERLFYFSCLSDYIKNTNVEDLYLMPLKQAEKDYDATLISSIKLVHKMLLEGDISPLKYEQRIREILKETKYVK